MAPLSFIFAILFLATANAFTVPRTAVRAFSPVQMAEDTEGGQPVERGVSVDQDGKSNVWAIEPKMEVSTKSSEEQGATALGAAGGIAAFVVVAGLILTNLPDPDQF
eukprot:CAMPEP_0172483422 /NCGR_PEP_ID=MMETSP1066-20121228/10444_1 /TAXON_ID=671091 /ORGANISM="Coscinodiscus wailesii, Strain CCMP2513" /LENGTH=106 /DNA_ID=CAMNT_0013247303 /DNA_START=83 /DNA_END=403 /DNA_ORIENTATION=+